MSRLAHPRTLRYRGGPFSWPFWHRSLRFASKDGRYELRPRRIAHIDFEQRVVTFHDVKRPLLPWREIGRFLLWLLAGWGLYAALVWWVWPTR